MRRMNEEAFTRALQEARTLFEKASNTSFSDTETLATLSISLSQIILTLAQGEVTDTEKDHNKIIAKAIRDPYLKWALLLLTDLLFRSEDYSKTASLLLEKKDEFLSVKALSFFEKISIRFVLSLLHITPKSAIILLRSLVRSKMKRIIFSRSNESLYEVLSNAEREGITVNINRLGEAILGEEEAKKRFEAYIDDLNNPLIRSVSIKLSSLLSNVSQVGFHEILPKMKEKLKKLLLRAQEVEQSPLISLDMEEFKDLSVSIDLIENIAADDEIKHARVGVVIQAYLPDSSEIFHRLVQASKERIKKGGTPLYIRLVKGANLLVEKLEASLRNWPQAPYHTKEETDAHFLLLLSELIPAIKEGHIVGGIATHNIFNIAYGIILSKAYGIEKGISFEMLNGMAPAVSRAVHVMTNILSLECPVAEDNDIASTISYLVRRLDENLDKEHFLPALSAAILGESSLWRTEKAKFRKSLENTKSISTLSLRQSRMKDHIESSRIVTEKRFTNCPDTDWSQAELRKEAVVIRDTWKEKPVSHYPLIIGGQPLDTALTQTREDPSIPKKVIHSYSLAPEELLHQTIIDMSDKHRARKESGWTWTTDEQVSFLLSLADEIAKRRFDFIGSMLREIAKPIIEADGEVSEAIDFCRYYAHLLLKERHFLTWKKDKNVALIASPWNFPLSLSLQHILQGLLSGHALLFKPAPEAIATGSLLFESILATGIDPSLIAFIPFRESPEGIRFLSDHRIDSLFVTGSTETARLFMRLSKNKAVYAEAGGKNCAFLSSLADKDLALKHIIQSAFGFSGQKCTALGLLIIDETLFSSKKFLHQLRDAAESLISDSAWNLAATVTPLARKPSKAFLHATHNLEEGESWLLPPCQSLDNPNLFYPSIKILNKPKTFSHLNELFGPCLSLIPAKSIEEALEITHLTQYGHTSGIYSLSQREQSYWIEKVQTANVFINRPMTGALVAKQPIGGGWKASSFGHGIKAGGPFSLRAVMTSSALGSTDPKQISDHKKVSVELKGEVLALLSILKTDESSLETTEFVSFARKAYAIWTQDFTTIQAVTDPIKGQDNLLQVLPKEPLVLIAHEQDTPIMIWAAFAMASISKSRLILNKACIDILKPYIHLEALSMLMKKWNWYMFEESSRIAMRLLADIPFPRIRAFRTIDSTLLNFISEQAFSIEMEPFSLDPRIDFLSFIKEKTVSIDYHRYGNVSLHQQYKGKEIKDEVSQVKETKTEESNTVTAKEK